MTDFLITQITLYPWFTWLLVFFAAAGIGYAAVWAYKVQAAAFAWLGYRRAVWHAKGVVRRRLADGSLYGGDCAVCAMAEADIAEMEAEMTGDDPPEYQHPDGEDGGFDWDGPPDDWSPVTTWGPPVLPHHEMAGLAEVLKRAHDLGLLDDDQLPDGPPAEPPDREVPRSAEELRRILAGELPDELAPEERCTNRDCDLFGFLHRPPCHLAPTQPAACYTDEAAERIGGLGAGPAMPPQPVREYLHPAVMDDLSSAGFSEHETTDGAVDSIYTRAMAREVEAMVTDGIIPTSEEEKR